MWKKETRGNEREGGRENNGKEKGDLECGAGGKGVGRGKRKGDKG